MNIVVCIKQVPDTTEIKIDPVKGTLIRTGSSLFCKLYNQWHKGFCWSKLYSFCKHNLYRRQDCNCTLWQCKLW